MSMQNLKYSVFAKTYVHIIKLIQPEQLKTNAETYYGLLKNQKKKISHLINSHS